MEIYVLGIKLKNLLFVFALIISIIIMGNNFQQIMEVYIKNNFLRWGTGISLSLSILYILFDTISDISDFFKEESTHNELNVSGEVSNAQNEFNLRHLYTEITDKNSINRTKYGFVEKSNKTDATGVKQEKSRLDAYPFCHYTNDELDILSLDIFQEIQLKTVPVFKEKGVFQTTMREITVSLIFEKNIIEIFSENAKDLENAVMKRLLCLSVNPKEILEIGSKQLIKNSTFKSIDDLFSVKEKPSYKLNEISEANVQVVVVYSEELLDARGIALLSDIVASSNELRLILFLTIGSHSSILLVLNFAQVYGQPIINVIDFKQYYGEDVQIIEGIYKSIMFNLMV